MFDHQETTVFVYSLNQQKCFLEALNLASFSPLFLKWQRRRKAFLCHRAIFRNNAQEREENHSMHCRPWNTIHVFLIHIVLSELDQMNFRHAARALLHLETSSSGWVHGLDYGRKTSALSVFSQQRCILSRYDKRTFSSIATPARSSLLVEPAVLRISHTLDRWCHRRQDRRREI